MMQQFVDTAISLTVVVTSGVTSAVVEWLRKVLFGHQTKVLPQLYYKESDLSDYLIQNCSSLSRVFCPPWWMIANHAQTIMPVFLPKPDMVFKRELVKLRDEGMLAIDWATSGIEELNTSAPVLLILPGLAGNANGCRHLVKHAVERGFRPVVFNKRGHGGCKITTPRLQNFCDPTDFKQVIEFVERKYPNARLASIGLSAGSGLLLAYLGLEQDPVPLVANVAISAGYDTDRVLNGYLRPPYDYLLLQGLRRIIQENKDVLSDKFDVSHALQSKTMIELQDRLYRQIYGYKTLQEHWLKDNPLPHMSEIKAPVLCINSRDDPICAQELIPFGVFARNQNLMLALMEKGGHCGFIEKEKLSSWAERTAVDYIASVLDYMENNSDT